MGACFKYSKFSRQNEFFTPPTTLPREFNMNDQKNEIGLSLIIPIYRNEENLESLIQSLKKLSQKVRDFEVVFVVDGSPDNCEKILAEQRAKMPFKSVLIVHSRNFGPYSAVRTGLKLASKGICGMISADLQEPLELILKFHQYLQNEDIDIAVGTRLSRNDGFFTDFTSKLFWVFYSSLINSEIPRGGVDVFALNSNAKHKLLEINENDSSLIAQLFWIGFNRIEVPYNRQKRKIGKSASSFRKRLNYMADSTLSFSSLPIKCIGFLGFLFLVFSTIYATYILYLSLYLEINPPGFASIVLIIMAGFSINLICLFVLGVYIWRTFKNTQNRPNAIVRKIYDN